MTQDEQRPAHPSAVALDAWVRGALGGQEARFAEAHVEGCGRCRSDVERLRRDRERFAAAVFERTVRDVELRGARRKWMLAWPLVAVPALAVALAVVFVLRAPPPPDEKNAIKGAPALKVFAQREGHVFPVQPGQELRSGDTLRFEIEPGGFRRLLIVSVDGAGTASVYVPFNGSQSVEVGNDTYVSPGSVILDDAPGPERVFALLADEPVASDAAVAALRELGHFGPDAIRNAHRLAVSAEVQLTVYWEKARR